MASPVKKLLNLSGQSIAQEVRRSNTNADEDVKAKQKLRVMQLKLGVDSYGITSHATNIQSQRLSLFSFIEALRKNALNEFKFSPDIFTYSPNFNMDLSGSVITSMDTSSFKYDAMGPEARLSSHFHDSRDNFDLETNITRMSNKGIDRDLEFQMNSIVKSAKSLQTDVAVLSTLVASDAFSISLRTGLPLKLIRRSYNRTSRRLQQEIIRNKHSIHVPPINSISTLDAIAKKKSKEKPVVTLSTLTGEARGLANHGQTCFLNAVIQALASLNPFVAYLERIVYLVCSSKRNGREDLQKLHSTSSQLSEVLLNALLFTNNFNKRSYGKSPSLDSSQITKQILTMVAMHHKQFRSSQSKNATCEQQDAQELLQALLGMIIAESPFGSNFDSREKDQPGSKSNDAFQLAKNPASVSATTLFTHEDIWGHNSNHEFPDEKHQFQNGAALPSLSFPPDLTHSVTLSDSFSFIHDDANSIQSLQQKSGNSLPSNENIIINSSINQQAESGSYDDEELSLSSMIIMMDKEQKRIQEKFIRKKKQPGTTSSCNNSLSTTVNSYDNEDNSTLAKCCSENGALKCCSESGDENGTVPGEGEHHTLSSTSSSASSYFGNRSNESCTAKEEKKQEDHYSLDVATSSKVYEKYDGESAFVESKICANINHNRLHNGISDVNGVEDKIESSAEKSSLDGISSNMPLSMQIMMKTLSPITPSPLSGWVGSTLQCCTCQHIRPIQNAPFLDIPIVPRAIAQNQFRGNYNNNSSLPSCTLDQCLSDFTSVERVQDVDCLSCSINKKVSNLEEESIMLKGAIENIISRPSSKQQVHDGLSKELERIETHLKFLKSIDPDDENDNSNNNNDEGFQDDFRGNHMGNDHSSDIIQHTENVEAPKPIRGDANKRLFLTRLPPLLCLHVKRLYFDPKKNRMAKAQQHIEFPEILDASQHCVYGSGDIGKSVWAGTCNDIVGNNASIPSNRSDTTFSSAILYRLNSLIVHSGNAVSGHYITIRRVIDASKQIKDYVDPQEDSKFSKDWALISDEKVTLISWEKVRNFQAYMLFYEAI